MSKYLGLFTDIDSVRSEFRVDADQPFPADDQIIVAFYEYEDYSGTAFVLYRSKDGGLFEVNGGHCSCNGLEGQWEPEETSVAALRMRKDAVGGSAVQELIDAALATDPVIARGDVNRMATRIKAENATEVLDRILVSIREGMAPWLNERRVMAAKVLEAEDMIRQLANELDTERSRGNKTLAAKLRQLLDEEKTR